MTDPASTEAVYDGQAHRWARREPTLLSDFTARPRVLDALGDLGGSHGLDLGCGEGYVARLVAEAGAASVFGVDLSNEMIRQARAAAPDGSDCELTFEAADAATLSRFPRASYERIVAVFLFNYLTRTQMAHVLRTAREHLAPGGRFVFTVPHPCFPYMRPPAAPFFFDTRGQDYLSGADTTYEGRIWHRDGSDVAVRCVHKTLADYFEALRTTGWTGMPEVTELHVTPEHIALDPKFFGPLEGHPLHLLFALGTEA